MQRASQFLVMAVIGVFMVAAYLGTRSGGLFIPG